MSLHKDLTTEARRFCETFKYEPYIAGKGPIAFVSNDESTVAVISQEAFSDDSLELLRTATRNGSHLCGELELLMFANESGCKYVALSNANEWTFMADLDSEKLGKVLYVISATAAGEYEWAEVIAAFLGGGTGVAELDKLQMLVVYERERRLAAETGDAEHAAGAVNAALVLTDACRRACLVTEDALLESLKTFTGPDTVPLYSFDVLKFMDDYRDILEVYGVRYPDGFCKVLSDRHASLTGETGEEDPEATCRERPDGFNGWIAPPIETEAEHFARTSGDVERQLVEICRRCAAGSPAGDEIAALEAALRAYDSLVSLPSDVEEFLEGCLQKPFDTCAADKADISNAALTALARSLASWDLFGAGHWIAEMGTRGLADETLRIFRELAESSHWQLRRIAGVASNLAKLVDDQESFSNRLAEIADALSKGGGERVFDVAVGNGATKPTMTIDLMPEDKSLNGYKYRFRLEDGDLAAALDALDDGVIDDPEYHMRPSMEIVDSTLIDAQLADLITMGKYDLCNPRKLPR